MKLQVMGLQKVRLGLVGNVGLFRVTATLVNVRVFLWRYLIFTAAIALCYQTNFSVQNMAQNPHMWTN